MSSKRISLAFTTLAFAAAGWAVACSGGSSGGTSSSTTNSTSGSTSGSNSSSQSGTGSSTTSSSGSTSKGSLLIDDMSNTTGQVHVAVPSSATPGYWFTTINDTGGSITPVPAANGGAWSYTAVTGPSDASISNAACIRGVTSPTQYSEAGEGFNFALQKIDAAPDSGAQAPAVEYDISSYTGISFWAYGAADAGPQANIRVLFPDHTTDPRGGVCVNDAAAASSQCYDSWQKTITIAPGWQFVTVTFASDLGQLGFGLSETSFDAAHVYGMTFQVNGPQTADAGVGTPFDLCIADINFVN
jgi:hypothetical protein